jgi:DNA-nicking Smr family endonuclease
MREDATIELPIDGVLDLHTFDPREVRDLVPEYLAACRDRGILSVRIIHGKGTGTLRRIVHSTLARIPLVGTFRLAGGDGGGWGATVVELRGPPAGDGPGEPVSRSAGHAEQGGPGGRA